MLMRLLASSAQVVTEKTFPFEHQYLRYLRLLRGRWTPAPGTAHGGTT
jgi:hypothetical protein